MRNLCLFVGRDAYFNIRKTRPIQEKGAVMFNY